MQDKSNQPMPSKNTIVSTPVPRLLILGIVLLGWILRIADLGFQPLWWDEGYTVYFATLPIPQLLQETAKLDHPPLYWLATKFWGWAAGFSPWSIRFFSALWGTLAIALTYRLARFILPAWEAAIAALFFAGGPFPLWHSREARMYSLTIALALLSGILALRLAGRPPAIAKRPLWFAYWGSLAIGPLVHYFLLLLLPVHGLLWFSQSRLRRRGLVAVGAAAVFSVPWLLFVWANLPKNLTTRLTTQSGQTIPLGELLYRLVRAAGWGTADEQAVAPGEFLYRLGGSYTVGYIPGFDSSTPFTGPGATFAILVFISLALTGAFFLARRASLKHDWIAGWLLIWLFLPVAGAYLIQTVLPFHNFIRLIGFVTPVLYITAASGLTLLSSRGKTGQGVAGVLGFLSLVLLFPFLQAYYTTPWDPSEDYRPLIQELASDLQPGDALLAEFPWQVGYLQSYLDSPLLTVYYPPLDIWAHNPPLLRAELENMLKIHGRLWYPFYQGLPDTLGVRIKRYLDRNFYLALDQPFGKTNLLLYAAQPL